MSLAGSLSDYISGQAQQKLAPYASLLPGGKMGLPISVSGSASSSASSGPSKSGDISGGTAFNIGGINLGTQYPTAATATGGSPTEGLASSIGGLGMSGTYLTIAAVGIAAIALLLLMRR